jgi:hypothetical protein
VRFLRETRDAARWAPDDVSSVNRDRRDRILDWREELERLEPDLPRLPAAARLAVRATVERFLREDTEAGLAPAGAREKARPRAFHDAA